MFQKDYPNSTKLENSFFFGVVQVNYTADFMFIERQVHFFVLIALLGMTVLLFILGLLYWDQDGQCALAGFLALGFGIIVAVSERSYRYEIDKTNSKMTCRWSGILGMLFNKKVEKTYLFKELAFIKIRQHSMRGRDTFDLRLVTNSSGEIELPSPTSLNKCMEYANLYKDFLDIRSPVQMPR